MKSIDEHIDELAQEARDLEKKLTLMSDLKQCMRKGHTWQFTVEDTFSTVDRVKLFCTNCGAEWTAPSSTSKIMNNNAHNLGIVLADLEGVEEPDTPDEITQPSESEYSTVDHKDVLIRQEETPIDWGSYNKSKLFKQVDEE
jgi:hypothetical protein